MGYLHDGILVLVEKWYAHTPPEPAAHEIVSPRMAPKADIEYVRERRREVAPRTRETDSDLPR